MSPIYFFIPSLVNLRIGSRTRRHFKNIETLTTSLKEYTESSSETNIIKNSPEGGIDKETILNNLFLFLLASFDTSAHKLTSAIYFLHAYPETRKKITDEIKKVFNSVEEITKEKLDSIDYLNYFIQEVMRRDSVLFTLYYKV